MVRKRPGKWLDRKVDLVTLRYVNYLSLTSEVAIQFEWAKNVPNLSYMLTSMLLVL